MPSGTAFAAAGSGKGLTDESQPPARFDSAHRSSPLTALPAIHLPESPYETRHLLSVIVHPSTHHPSPLCRAQLVNLRKTPPLLNSRQQQNLAYPRSSHAIIRYNNSILPVANLFRRTERIVHALAKIDQ
ncbi:hypothetical protein MBLNU457_5818t1 [Dothideomycetes sp. NU457]